MADELTLSLSLGYEKGNVTAFERAVAALGIDVSGSRFIHRTQEIGTSEEALTVSELASLGVMWVKNLDNTNYVEIRSATGAGNDIIKLLPGEQWVFRWGSDVSAPYAIANSASCYIEYAIWEN